MLCQFWCCATVPTPNVAVASLYPFNAPCRLYPVLHGRRYIWHFELTTDCVTLLAGLLWPKPFRCSLQSGPFERKQHIYAMDYRHVAKNFRRCALLVQLSLLSSLAAYAAYRALRIMQSGDTPAADISVKHWHGYSAWAVCCIPGYDPTRYCNGVRAAGVGFLKASMG